MSILRMIPGQGRLCSSGEPTGNSDTAAMKVKIDYNILMLSNIKTRFVKKSAGLKPCCRYAGKRKTMITVGPPNENCPFRSYFGGLASCCSLPEFVYGEPELSVDHSKIDGETFPVLNTSRRVMNVEIYC